MQTEQKTTIDAEEVARFSKIADEWWDPKGKFAPLHRINPLRIQYIVEQIQASGFNVQSDLRLLDIGCGGGLIAEPFARLGASVTAIDAGEKNIRVAQAHAETSGLKIDYRCTTAEALTAEPFDVVLALEIIEHVSDVSLFIEATAKLVKPGGLLIISTLNRTAKSYALAIIGAEYVLRWLPIGTHTWSKFLKPHELVGEIEKHAIAITDMKGMVMNPRNFQWRWDKDLSVNYIVSGRK